MERNGDESNGTAVAKAKLATGGIKVSIQAKRSNPAMTRLISAGLTALCLAELLLGSCALAIAAGLAAMAVDALGGDETEGA